MTEEVRDELDNIDDEEEVGSPTEQVSLDKNQLEQMFGDTGEQQQQHDVDKKTTQLSKNDVEKLAHGSCCTCERATNFGGCGVAS